MPRNDYENLRHYFKPDNIQVLFVGESRPQSGNFFYKGDSALYRETKKAFNEYFAKDIFTLKNFKDWHCWLYDICDDPVNGMPTAERRERIRANIPRLIELIQQEKPDLIIVCKKTLIEPEIRKSCIMKSYQYEESIFFLPFPGCGNQRKYRKGVIDALIRAY